MIKKSFLMAVVLFFAHLCIVIALPDAGGSMGQKDSNIVIVQRFLYTSKRYKYVCVGSSMAEKIISDSIPDFYNLGLLGSCALDGLHYVSMKPDDALPDIVYVEINNAHSNAFNTSLLSIFDSPLEGFLKSYIPNLREEYRPMTMLKSNMMKVLRKNMGKTAVSVVDTVVLRASVDYMKEDGWLKWGWHLDYRDCIEGFSMLKNYIDKLESRGVKVVFFMVPMNKEIERGPKISDLVRHVHSFFPDSVYHYMPVDSTCYPTSDGLHLDEMSAKAFTSFFKANMMHTD